jgi:putative endonuclease
VGFAAPGTVGSNAERWALDYLVRRGLRKVARNFRSRGGEIDLVMLDDECLVFIEVRYRKSSSFMTPATTVDSRKQRKILRTAALFLSRHGRYANRTIRFDVVAITGEEQRRIDWVRDAFRPTDSTL